MIPHLTVVLWKRERIVEVVSRAVHRESGTVQHGARRRRLDRAEGRRGRRGRGRRRLVVTPGGGGAVAAHGDGGGGRRGVHGVLMAASSMLPQTFSYLDFIFRTITMLGSYKSTNLGWGEMH